MQVQRTVPVQCGGGGCGRVVLTLTRRGGSDSLATVQTGASGRWKPAAPQHEVGTGSRRRLRRQAIVVRGGQGLGAVTRQGA